MIKEICMRMTPQPLCHDDIWGQLYVLESRASDLPNRISTKN